MKSESNKVGSHLSHVEDRLIYLNDLNDIIDKNYRIETRNYRKGKKYRIETKSIGYSRKKISPIRNNKLSMRGFKKC